MIKAICNTQYKNLEGIFDLGDEVEIESILSTERKAITNHQRITCDSNGHLYSSYGHSEDVYAEIGSYEGYRIKSKNGNYYNHSCIRGAIGYIPISKIFTKL